MLIPSKTAGPDPQTRPSMGLSAQVLQGALAGASLHCVCLGAGMSGTLTGVRTHWAHSPEWGRPRSSHTSAPVSSDLEAHRCHGHTTGRSVQVPSRHGASPAGPAPSPLSLGSAASHAVVPPSCRAPRKGPPGGLGVLPKSGARLVRNFAPAWALGLERREARALRGNRFRGSRAVRGTHVHPYPSAGPSLWAAPGRPLRSTPFRKS